MANDTVDLSGAYTTDEQEKASKEETAPKTKVAQGPTVDLSGHYGTEDKPAQQAKEEAMPVGEVHAAPSAWQSFKGAVTHPVEYLGDVKSDVEQGGGRTVVGRTLGHMQARGDQGYQAPQPPAPEVTAPRPQTEPGGHIPIMAGMVQGPPKLARGLARIGRAESEVAEKPAGETGKELASAGTEAAGGAMQTLGPALISPTALPRVVGGMLVGGEAEKGLKKIGVPEEYAGLGGTVAGLAAAGAPEIAESPVTAGAIRGVGRAYQKALRIAPEAGAVAGGVAGAPHGPGGVAYGTYTGGRIGKIAQKVLPEGRALAEFGLNAEEKAAHRLGIDAAKADQDLAKAVDEHSKYAASEARGPIDPETNPAYKKSVESVRKAQEAAAEAHYHWNEAKDAAARAKTAPVEAPAPAVEAPMALTPEQEAAQAARIPKEPVVPAEKAPEVAPEPKAVPEAPKTPLGQITPPEKPAEKPGRLGTLRVGEGGKVVDTEPEVQQKIEEGLQRGTAEAKPIALKPLGVREQEALGKIKLAPEVPEVTEVTGKKLGVPTGPVEDIGAKVRAGEKAVPRTGEERRARVRTPEEEQTTRLFKQARKELGEDASSDEVMARVDDLKVAEAKTTKGVEASPEDLSKVEAVVKDHTDQDLARLGKKYGVNEADYDFSKRDEKRHRVERDQFVKDLLAKMPPEDVTNISGLASKFDNRTDTGTWTEAERSGLSKAQRARAIMQEHAEGAKEAPAAEVQKAESVPEETKEAEDIDKKVADAHNEEGGSSLHDEKGNLKGKEGYAFSLSKSLEKVAEGTKLTPEDIKEYRERPEVQEALKKDPNAFVGTWESGGKSYMDVSTFETDLEKAKELGKQNEQKAIYDLKNGKEIPLEEPKEAEPKTKTTEAKPAQYDEAVRLVTEAGKGSTKDLREKLGISQGEAVKLLDRMESEGVVGPAEGAQAREVISLKGRNQGTLSPEQRAGVQEVLAGRGQAGEAPKVLPTGDALIKKYGESSGDPADTTFILKDGRGVANTGTDHDIMLGGKATDKLPPREQFVAEGNIRVRPRQGTIGGREVSLSIPESGITPKQLAYVKKMAPQLGSGAVMIEVGKPGGDYRVLNYGDATPENLEKTLRELGPVRPEGYPKEAATVSGGSQAATAEAKEGEVKLPELAEKHLTPEEKAGVTKSARGTQGFIAKLEKLPDVQEFVDIAKAGEGGRKWYQRSTAAFDSMVKEAPEYFKEGDRDKFLGLLASTSPQQTVALNLKETLSTWAKYVDMDRPTGSKLEKMLSKELTLPEAKVPNAMKALAGEPLWPDLSKNENFKVPSFHENLKGFLNKVTNDGWMGLFSESKGLGKPSNYHPISVVTRAAAEKLGWNPAEAQAAIWAFTKAFTEHGETEPSTIRQYSEDFSDIMAHDQEVRAQLKTLGVDLGELDKHLKAIGEKPKVSSRASASFEDSLRKLADRIERTRGKGTIPAPKTGLLGFTDEDTEFNPEEFGPKKNKPLGKIKVRE